MTTRNPGYISKAERIARHAAARDEASGRLAGKPQTCECMVKGEDNQLECGNVAGYWGMCDCHCHMDRSERAEEEQLAEHRAWIAEKSKKSLDNVMSPEVSSLLSPETPITKEKEPMADLTLKRVTRDGRHVLYEIPGVAAVRIARGAFPANEAPPATIPIGDVFAPAKEVKAVDPVKAAKRAEAKANQLETITRLAAKHEARAAKAKAKLEKILAKAGSAPGPQAPAAEQPAGEGNTSEQPAT